jgi:hypothetical protein
VFKTTDAREKGFSPTFRIQGRIYHSVPSLFPAPGQLPRFLQVYFTGSAESQVAHRKAHFPETDPAVILDLTEFLHQHHSYVKNLKMAMEKLTGPELKLVIRADKAPQGEHRGRYNAPAVEEIAVVMAGDPAGSRDIVLTQRDGQLRDIKDTNRAYDCLQYPLIFWNGQDGYHFGIPLRDPTTKQPMQKTMSSMQFYSFHLMPRQGDNNVLLRFKDLLSQFIVDMYVKIESERLAFICTHQRQLRAESYIHLQDAIREDGGVANAGQLVILPSTFTGGPRYMHEHTQDAMTYVRKFGTPDLFITFTCNPKWPDIRSNLFPGQEAKDRHDIVSRVFRLKVVRLMSVIKQLYAFGTVRCDMYTIEWQKRGLPHAHILIWLVDKLRPNQVDRFICAEIPNASLDPELFHIVTSHMIHGPCGTLNPQSPCMKEGKCTKRYPRQLLDETQTGSDGYPLYRRRKPGAGGFTTNLRMRGHVEPVEVDNKWIVPYCPLLSKMFDAHINVESCQSIKSIKYVCKYVNKGSDMATFELEGESRDEVGQYQTGRYVSSSEAAWRIFGFPIHERSPTVVHLAVHLENGQRVYFTEATAAETLADPKDTTLMAFFKLCREDPFARTIKYAEVPSYYTWNATGRKWSRRKQGVLVPGTDGVKRSDALGRVYTVHPKNQECYYLRILLHEVAGPTSFKDLKTYNGQAHPTFQAACQARGLLEDDSHWDATLEEASVSRSPRHIRSLFAIMLTASHMSDPRVLWAKHKDSMAEDFLHQQRQVARNPGLEFNDEVYNLALVAIEDLVFNMGGNPLGSYGLPAPRHDSLHPLQTEMVRETSYNLDSLRKYVEENEPKLLNEQRAAYSLLVDQVMHKVGGLYFLDAPGGTGKTFVLNLLLARVRMQKCVSLAVASSGIAATLLAGGRTAHSSFKLPLDMATNENPTCNITRSSGAGRLLQECRLIIWDECTMSHKRAYEALDRTLRDLRKNNTLMGGVVVVLAGDFRQTLPVIPRGTRADELQACLKASSLWQKVMRMELRTNMRAVIFGDNSAGQFAHHLQQLGDGKAPCGVDGKIDMSVIANVVSCPQDLVQQVFPNIYTKFNDPAWLCERAILAPRNDYVNTINHLLLQKVPGETRTYQSVDGVTDVENAVHYPVEFLNSLNPPGTPPHLLHLKVGIPVMLLRNLEPPRLCNGTRLKVKQLLRNCIEVTILTGCARGEDVFIPRIPIIPSDMPFQFKRLQLPVRLCFAMSINKSQGQSLRVVGVDLTNPCFSHGQLYVACSRTGTKENLFVYAPGGRTENVVYQEALKKFFYA